MSITSSGIQQSTNAFQFFNLTTPIFLPTLTSSSGADSPHLPLPHHSQAPEVIGFTDLQPDRSGVDFGQQTFFRYANNDNDILKTCTLCLDVTGLVDPNGCVLSRYIDDLGLGCVEKAEFWYGGNVLQTLHGDELHFKMMQETAHDELTRKCKLQGAGLSDAQRAVLYKNKDTFLYTDIPFWWSQKYENHWHQYAFQRLTRIVITFRPVAYLLQMGYGFDPLKAVNGTSQTIVGSSSTLLPTPQTGNGTTYLKNHWLRFEVSVPSLATKQYYQSMVSSTGEAGWNYLFPDVQSIRDITIASGTTTVPPLQLNTFTKYGYNLRFVIRPYDNLQPNVSNNYRWQLMDLGQFSFDISGNRYLQTVDDFYVKHAQIGKYYFGNEQLPVYNVFLTDYPDIYNHGMGGFEFTNIVNPTLNITFNTATGCVGSFNAYLSCHNYVRCLLDGAKSAAETIQPI